MTPLDTLGWVGTAFSLLFYFFLAVKRVLPAYIALSLSAAVWGAVGVLSGLGSLVAKEVVVVAFIIWGWRNWSKPNGPDKPLD